jgi:hypothetical protein
MQDDTIAPIQGQLFEGRESSERVLNVFDGGPARNDRGFCLPKQLFHHGSV